MPIKQTLLAAAAALALSGAALANEAKGPILLTDVQLDGVVAAGDIEVIKFFPNQNVGPKTIEACYDCIDNAAILSLDAHNPFDVQPDTPYFNLYRFPGDQVWIWLLP